MRSIADLASVVRARQKVPRHLVRSMMSEVPTCSRSLVWSLVILEQHADTLAIVDSSDGLHGVCQYHFKYEQLNESGCCSPRQRRGQPQALPAWGIVWHVETDLLCW